MAESTKPPAVRARAARSKAKSSANGGREPARKIGARGPARRARHETSPALGAPTLSIASGKVSDVPRRPRLSGEDSAAPVWGGKGDHAESEAPSPAFGNEFKYALEAEAFRRAHDGVEEPVVYQGRFMYLRGPEGEPLLDAEGNPRRANLRKYSDTLLMFLMKAAMPEKYRERHQAAQDGFLRFNIDTGIEGAPGSAIE